MKRILLLSYSIALVFCASLFINDAKASHAAGAEIIYTHIGDSTYQFFFKFYRDCSGINRPQNVTMCFYNTCTNTSYSKVLNLYAGQLPPDRRNNGSPVSPGCSQFPTNCDSPQSQLPGYQEWWYSTIEPIPFSCNEWKFSVSINARNGSQNIGPANPGGFNLYVETTFNSTVTWNNSSPYYSIKPIPYVCLGQKFTYNNGAKDPDGDSLWSEVINPLTSASCSSQVYNTRLTPNSPAITFPSNPFQTNNTFSINGGTGTLQFIAAQQGAHTLTVRTHEYKNGVKVGSIMRDIQVQVIPCNIPPPVFKVDTISGGLSNNGQIYACAGQEVDFCFDVTSTDPDAILLAEDNLAQSIPNATITYSNLRTDSVRVCFNWKPTLADAGKNHTFQTILKDSTCKPPGILLQYIEDVSIFVWGKTEAIGDTNICKGEPAFLGVSGGGNYSWSVISGTNASLNNPNSATPTALPTETTIYQVVSQVNEFCPDLNKDTVTVEVELGPAIAGQPDDTTCPNNERNLDIGIIKKGGVQYTIQWTPSTGLSNDKIENPSVITKNDATYFVEVGASDTRCKTYDTVIINILDGFQIENPDTAICEGESVTVRGSGDVLYSYRWQSDDPTPTYSPVDVLETTITPSDTGEYMFTILAGYKNCVDDSIARFKIDVQPNPIVKVSDDATICYGDTLQLSSLVTPSSYKKYNYSWTPGALLDNSNSANPIFSGTKEGVNNLVLTVKTSAGCEDNDDIDINVYNANFLFLPNDTVICPGDSLIVDMKTDGDPKYYWSPDQDISSVTSHNPMVWPVADQTYTVYGIDTFGCLDTNEINIAVRPRAVMDIPEKIELYKGDKVKADPGGNCLYFNWFPALGLSRADISNPIISPDVNTRYIVTGRTDAGCVVTDSIDVIVKDGNYIELPNAFTPGNNSNNLLRVISKGVVELKAFTVYNRWGEKVFETNNLSEGWDGRYNGSLQPMGVYMYKVQAVTQNGKTVTKLGNVTLIR